MKAKRHIRWAKRGRGYHPDISLDWDTFPVGASVFIPTVDVRATLDYVERIRLAYDYTLKAKPTSRNGLVGVRVWRMADAIE